MEVFDHFVSRGVSANLCLAVSKLIESGGGLDLSLTWASSHKGPLLPSVVRFEPYASEILQDAANFLKEREPRPETKLLGFVTSLSRSKQQDAGKIIVKALIEERLTSVAVSLNDELYQKASAAHTERKSIVLEGDLLPEGSRWWMTKITKLEIVD